MVKHCSRSQFAFLDSEGAEVKKVEQFVLDAYTYTEAETRMTQICEYEGIRPFEITQLTKTNLIEVIRYPECDKWFRVKVAMTTFDADRGTEKESNQHILLSATDVRDAYDKVSQHMNQLGVGYVIPSIAYQKIVEVFPQDEWQWYGQEQPKEPRRPTSPDLKSNHPTTHCRTRRAPGRAQTGRPGTHRSTTSRCPPPACRPFGPGLGHVNPATLEEPHFLVVAASATRAWRPALGLEIRPPCGW